MTIDYGDYRLPDRFWDKVHTVPETSCWVWTGAIKKEGGNPTYTLDRRVTTVLQVYFRIFFPRVDRDKHRPRLECGVNDCVNPNHVIILEKGICNRGHNARKEKGGGCAQCKHDWYLKRRKGSGQRRPSKNEIAGKTVVTSPTDKPELSVFGDKKPDKLWRPPGWSEQPSINLKVTVNQWSHQPPQRELERSG